MKIITEYDPDDENYGQYASLWTTIVTNEGKESAHFQGGEPEDNSLTRDLSDAFLIKNMLEMAYNAGKNGESLEIEEL